MLRMQSIVRSTATAVFIAVAIQSFTVGVLAPRLPREVCRPGVRDTRSITVPKVRTVAILNEDGAINVSTHPRDVDAIEIKADIRVYTQNSEQRLLAEQYLDSLIQVEQDNDMLRVISEPAERPDGLDLRVDYKVVVPEGTHMNITGNFGNVLVSRGCGHISVLGNNTDIDIEEPVGNVTAKSTNGRIRVYDAAGDTRLETVNGSIYANMRGGSLNAATTNGHVYVTLLEPDVTSCDLTVTNGGITLVTVDGISAEITAATGRGTIRSDLEFQEEEGVQRLRELHGVLGDGKTRLSLQSLNGDIWITRSAT